MEDHKRTGLKKVLGIAAALMWLVFGVTGAVRWIAGDGGLMAVEMLRNAPPEQTGLPEKDYAAVGRMTAEYLTGETAEFQYVIPEGEGKGTVCFQAHEAAHMADCRDLIRLDTVLCIGSGIAATVLTAAGWFRKSGRKQFLRGILRGLLAAAVIAGGMLIWALVDYDGLFVTFHRVAFRNDGWLLNPRTDLLIRLMPERFFIRLGIRGLLRFIVMPVALAAAARIGLRRVKEPSLGPGTASTAHDN